MKTEKPKMLIRWYILGAIGAVLTILAAGIVVPALPYLLSFAAGAMLYVVVEALILEMSQGRHSNVGTVFFCGRLQRDDGAGCCTGVTVGGPKAISLSKSQKMPKLLYL